jgi:hypothetical protein
MEDKLNLQCSFSKSIEHYRKSKVEIELGFEHLPECRTRRGAGRYHDEKLQRGG